MQTDPRRPRGPGFNLRGLYTNTLATDTGLLIKSLGQLFKRPDGARVVLGVRVESSVRHIIIFTSNSLVQYSTIHTKS